MTKKPEIARVQQLAETNPNIAMLLREGGLAETLENWETASPDARAIASGALTPHLKPETAPAT